MRTCGLADVHRSPARGRSAGRLGARSCATSCAKASTRRRSARRSSPSSRSTCAAVAKRLARHPDRQLRQLASRAGVVPSCVQGSRRCFAGRARSFARGGRGLAAGPPRHARKRLKLASVARPPRARANDGPGSPRAVCAIDLEGIPRKYSRDARAPECRRRPACARRALPLTAAERADGRARQRRDVPLHRHRGQQPPVGDASPARMQRALAAHDTLARACRREARRPRVKMTGDGMCAVFADPLRRDRRDARVPAGARAAPGRRRPRAARALRHPRRHRRAPRRRLLRQHGQPCRAHHERGARRAGAAVAGGRRPRARPAARGDLAARPRAWSGCATSRAPSASTRCCTRRCATTSRRCARSRPRRTTCRSRPPRSSAASASSTKRARLLARTRLLTLIGAGRHRQDAPVAAGRRRGARRLSRRRVVRRARAARRIRGSCHRRSRRCSACKEERGRVRSSTRWSRLRADKRAPAGARQLRAPARRLRRARRRAAAAAPRAADPGDQPRAAAHPRRDDLSRCRRWRCPTSGRADAVAAMRQYPGGAPVRRARRARCCPSFRSTDAQRAGRRRDLPAPRRHSARDRARRGARARAAGRRRSRRASTIASAC